MLENKQFRSMVYAVLSSMAIGLSPIFIKLTTESVNSESFTIYWSFMAFVNGSIYAVWKRGAKEYRIFGPGWPWVVVMGILVAINVLCFTTAVNIADPTVVSFFSRLDSVFAVFLGMLIFKERMNRIEVAGTVATIAGALVMTYGAGEIILLALLLTLINSVSNAGAMIVAKVAVRQVRPDMMVALSRLTGAVIILIYALILGALQAPTPRAFIIIAVGSIIGPFLGFFLTYQALAIGDVSRVTAVKSCFPFFVALYSFLIFGTTPGPSQWAGGLIIVAGVLVLVAGQSGAWSRSKGSTAPA
jgi:drug/metabolite transporter (DMT)-like permease